MKYNQYAVKNNKGQYIKYPTAYNYKTELTDSLYDVHLWNLKEDAERLADHLIQVEGIRSLIVVLV